MRVDPPPGAAQRSLAPGPRHARHRITIVVAMQARLDRECMAALIRCQPDFEVAGLAATSREVLSLCTSLRPRVLVLSALIPWPPDVMGVSAVRLCRPETQILALAPHAADRCAQLNPVAAAEASNALSNPNGTCLISALVHGACSALHRDAGSDELFEAIRSTSNGERWIGSGVADPAPPAVVLSSRERAVSRMIGNGSSNKEIAAELGITEPTVKKHISHVLRKLELHDRLQLGLLVARHPLMFETD